MSSSIYLQLADVIADALQADPRCGTVRYGRPGSTPSTVDRCVSVDVGPSLPAGTVFSGDDWVTTAYLCCEARPISGVHRSAAHAADELGTLVRELLALDRATSLGAALVALGVYAYQSDQPGVGHTDRCEGAIARDVQPGTVPVGIESFSLRVVHRIARST
jgi:hypothetical protein